MALKVKETRRNSTSKTRALQDVVQEETTRLNIDLPLSLHRQVKIRAAEEGGTMTGIVAQALDAYLKK